MTKRDVEFAPWLGVFETLRVIEGRPLFVREHEAELNRAAAVLGLTSELDITFASAPLPPQSGRWRWLVTLRGTETFFVEEAASSTSPLALSVSSIRVGSRNWDARYKTVSYLSHIQALRTAETEEVILLNEHRCVASAARANLFWRRGDQLYTPHPEAGCRSGVVRQFVCQRGEVEQGHYSLDDLCAADEIFVTNSMRGIVSVLNLEGRSFEDQSSANALREAYEIEVNRQLTLPVQD